MIVYPSWMKDAACRTYPTEWFFVPDDRRVDERSLPGRYVCLKCPVKDKCLEEALKDRKLDHGIRGGMTSRQRKCLRRRLKAMAS